MTINVPQPNPNRIYYIFGILIIIVAAFAYNTGTQANTKPQSTQTISLSPTVILTYTTQTIATQTQIELSTISIPTISTVTNTVQSIANVYFTSTTTTTTTTTLTTSQTFGLGLYITNYRLYLLNIHPDSILKLNLTVNLVNPNPYLQTTITEVTNIILIPPNGNANDIKFIPNPITTQTSNIATTISQYLILNHQIVQGTYIIEYIITTSNQGSTAVYTTLEVT